MRALPTIDLEITSGGIARVEMARPELFDAFDEAMIQERDSLFAQFDVGAISPEVREGFAAFRDEQPAAWIKPE